MARTKAQQLKLLRVAMVGIALIGIASVVGGCALGALIGGMEKSRREQDTHPVDAEYEGLTEKSYAVVVAADRMIQADYPQLVAYMTQQIDERLAEFAGASGHVPSEKVLRYQYENPRWTTIPITELAQNLGVDRLIHVELYDFHLFEPGNRHLWDGVAAGNIAIIESDSPLPDEYGFERLIQVRFPGGEASYGPSDMPAPVVMTELARRFVERGTWLFYRHEEPYYMDY